MQDLNLQTPGYEKSLDIGSHPGIPNSAPLEFVFPFWNSLFVPMYRPRRNADWGQIGVTFLVSPEVPKAL